MMNRKFITAALVASALTIAAFPAMAQNRDSMRPFDPSRDVYMYVQVPNDRAELTGTVTSVQGLKFLTMTEGGSIVGVDMAELPYNPTAPEYEPRLEIGDTVVLTGYVTDMPNEIMARDILGVKKAYMETAERQRLIIEHPADITPAAGDNNENQVSRRPMSIQQ